MPRSRRGDDDRLEEILERYGRVLRTAVLRTLPAAARDGLDDAVQEARIRTWRALVDERPVERWESWLYRVGVTCALDVLRRRRRTGGEAPLDEDRDGTDGAAAFPAPGAAAIDRLVAREESGRIMELLAELADDRRRAVALHLRGFARREIVELTGWDDFKVRNLLHRGLAQLRDRCRAEGIEPP